MCVKVCGFESEHVNLPLPTCLQGGGAHESCPKLVAKFWAPTAPRSSPARNERGPNQRTPGARPPTCLPFGLLCGQDPPAPWSVRRASRCGKPAWRRARRLPWRPLQSPLRPQQSQSPQRAHRRRRRRRLLRRRRRRHHPRQRSSLWSSRSSHSSYGRYPNWIAWSLAKLSLGSMCMCSRSTS